MKKREFIKTLISMMGGYDTKQGTWEIGWDAAISDAIAIAEELDEPETLSEEWIENHTASANTISYYSEEDVHVVTVEKLKNLLVPKQDKPVVPQFVADWIEKQMKFGYEDVFISMTRLRERAPEKVKFWFRNNSDTYAHAWLDGYEVEKEKVYRVRAGNRYVRFNLDGSIIGVKKDNSIVCLERLSKLPFDYRKAVESGIITLEEVTE